VTDVFSPDATWRRMNEFEPDTVITLEALIARLPEYERARLAAHSESGMASAGTSQIEYDLITKSGVKKRFRQVRITEHVEGYGMIARGAEIDITDLHQKQEELSVALNALERSCELTGTGLITIDTVTGGVNANSVWRRLFEFSPNESLDIQSVKTRLLPDERSGFDPFIQRILSSDTTEFYDYTYVSRDGDSRRFRVAAVSEHVPDYGIVMHGAELDITDLHEKQQALAKVNNKLNEQTEQQRKLFGIISHELRTPASAIQMLSNELDIDDVERDELQSVTTHLLNVIDDLRTAVNPSTEVEIHRAPFELATLIREVERQTSTLASGSGFSMEIRSPSASGASASFVSDAYRLRAVLTNLIRNSVFHSGGSRIWLSVEVTDDNTESILTFRVEDNGKGIPEDQIDRLFEPFERGDTKASGTGVGMYLIKSWTEKLGGRVSYTPSDKGGACFTVTLRVPQAKMTQQDDSEATRLLEAKAILQGKRIMLVEDDRILRKTTTRLLEKNFNVQVITAADGNQALELLKNESVELILTDYFMPNLDGRELIRALREQGRMLPIIALTAATIGQEQDELKDAGADVVLPKPLDVHRFAVAILDFEAVGRL